MDNIIEVKNLTKSYGKLVALDDFSLEVKQGEILGLLGPNGCGKSTCINTILSLLKFDKGSIKIFGKEMNPNAYDIKKDIGVVFQEVAVFEELTVFQNINYFCGLYIKDKKLRKQYVDEAIKLVALEEFVKFVPKKLSGGLLRRLNIACGIAHKPKLIFLDEPTVAVDPQSRNNILEGIKILNEQGATIVYTSHYMEEVEQLCNRIVIMDHGKIVASGTNEQLKNSVNLGEKITMTLDNIKDISIEDIESKLDITHIDVDEHTITLSFKTSNNLGVLVDYLRSNNILCNSIFSERPTLNDVFLELTGKELRD